MHKQKYVEYLVDIGCGKYKYTFHSLHTVWPQMRAT